jgi:shikimate dehydrogenase
MPLKEEATKLAVSVDKAAEATGAVNTLVRSESGWLGFNTDVFGIVQAVHNANLGQLNRVLIIGSGATATSAMVAIKQLAPAAEVFFLARNSRTRDRLILAAKALGLKAKKSGSLKRAIKKSDLTIATLPGGALDAEAEKMKKARGLKPSGALLDVAYQPWPSAFAQLWLANNKPIISGLEMLLWQAVAQIRIFTTGDPALPLPNEVAVVEAMRHSLEQ